MTAAEREQRLTSLRNDRRFMRLADDLLLIRGALRTAASPD